MVNVVISLIALAIVLGIVGLFISIVASINGPVTATALGVVFVMGVLKG